MIRKATRQDKARIMEVLTAAFIENKSVNYILKKDQKKKQRIAALMDYSFEVCMLSGEVFLDEASGACAMIQYPEQKPKALTSALLDLKLIRKGVGIRNIPRALKRESTIKAAYPKEPVLYLWFVGVKPDLQGRGIGSKLLAHVLELGKEMNRPVYLETSTQRNLPWYQYYGFKIYHQLEDFGFPFYFLRWSEKDEC